MTSPVKSIQIKAALNASLSQAVKKKTRVRLVEYWIEVAKECYHIGNFNSLMAIIAGLNMAPVARLKKTVRYLHLW